MPFQPDYQVPVERLPYTMLAASGAAAPSSVGVLMLHGFMGSPYSSRPLAHFLAERGVTVHCPLLPGHGHWPDKFHKVSHRAWIAEAAEGLETLRQMCREIFLMGHSMGNVLAAHLLRADPNVRGVILLAPIYDVPDSRLNLIKYIRPLVPWLYPHKSHRMQGLVRERVLDFDPTFDFDAPDAESFLRQATRMPTSGLDEMRKMVQLGQKLWPQVNTPTLILDGGHDIAVSPGSGAMIFQQIPARDKQHHYFPQAGHELMRPQDPAHLEVWNLIVTFIQQHANLNDSSTENGTTPAL